MDPNHALLAPEISRTTIPAPYSPVSLPFSAQPLPALQALEVIQRVAKAFTPKHLVQEHIRHIHELE